MASTARIELAEQPFPRLLHVLQQAQGRCWIAYSGGLDSSVLLAAAQRLQPGSLQVVHVHHGISPQADAWEQHCRERCAQLQLPIRVLHVAAATPPRGASPEAYARHLRYHALMPLLDTEDCLLTAQHRTDQAETLLLALLRGSGPAALGAMPERRRLGRGWLLRPLLGHDREQLQDYARTLGLHWIEDDSNRSLRPDRNYLRHQVWPQLRARWPALDSVLGRAARHQQDSSTLLEALAVADLQSLGDSPGLPLALLGSLAAARRRNLLCHWFRQHTGRTAPVWLLAQLPGVIGARANRNPVLRCEDMELQRYRGALYLHQALPVAPAAPLHWRVAEPIALPPGTLHGTAMPGRGLSPEALRDGCLELRFRSGGERLGAPPGRSLKKFLQQRRVYPWLRPCLPLVYHAHHIVCVPGLWTDPALQAPSGVVGLEPVWSPAVRLTADDEHKPDLRYTDTPHA